MVPPLVSVTVAVQVVAPDTAIALGKQFTLVLVVRLLTVKACASLLASWFPSPG